MRKRNVCAFAAVLLLISGFAAAETEAPAPERVQVPIIMYHSLAGRGKSTAISSEAFEGDLRYLRETGYEAVTLTALVDFVHHGKALPEKPVVLTFDDGYYNNYSLGLPLVKAYNTPIVVSVIGKDTEIWSGIPSADEKNGHLTWNQIREMAETGLVEIANHTWDLHKEAAGRKGVAIKPGEDRAQYGNMLREDVLRLQENLARNSGVSPLGFTYPFGRYCGEAAEELVQMGFSVTLACHEGVNTLIQGDKSCLFELCRYNRTPERSIKAILETIECAHEKKTKSKIKK